MALTNSTWRKHSFKVGNVYTALEAIKGVPINFSLGLIYVLDSISYSHYDSSTVLTFRDSGSEMPIQWWWHDDETETAAELFVSKD